MKLVEDLSQEELKRRHIKIYRYGNPCTHLPTELEALNQRLDDLESQQMPSLYNLNHMEEKPEISQVGDWQETGVLIDRINQLKAQIIHLEKKINEHLDVKPNEKKPLGMVPL